MWLGTNLVELYLKESLHYYECFHSLSLMFRSSFEASKRLGERSFYMRISPNGTSADFCSQGRAKKKCRHSVLFLNLLSLSSMFTTMLSNFRVYSRIHEPTLQKCSYTHPVFYMSDTLAFPFHCLEKSLLAAMLANHMAALPIASDCCVGCSLNQSRKLAPKREFRFFTEVCFGLRVTKVSPILH